MLLTIQQTADLFGYGPQTIYAWVRKQAFPGIVRIGPRARQIRIDESKVKEFIANGGNTQLVSGKTNGVKAEDHFPPHHDGNWKAREGMDHPHRESRTDLSDDTYDLLVEGEQVSKLKGSNYSPGQSLEGSFREGRI